MSTQCSMTRRRALRSISHTRHYVNSVSRLDDVASGLAQHLAHVAEPVPGPGGSCGPVARQEAYFGGFTGANRKAGHESAA